MPGIAKTIISKEEDKINVGENLLRGYEIIKKNILDEINNIRSQGRKFKTGDRKIKADLTSEEKETFKTMYLQAAQYAKSLSNYYINNKEKNKKYDEEYKKLIERASEFGSTINTKVVPKTTFEDVKGLYNVKKLIKSFIFMAKNPDLMAHYKIEGGLGLLMYGAPGTGKTMFAEAIANAMNLPLFIVTPADIFKSYVGESEQAVKKLFEELDNCLDGAILFVDECESIFSKRTADTKDYKAAVTTELLQRINGFGVNGSKRILIAATNRPDVIDAAYLRYKRFSHLVHVLPPDDEAKKAIIYSKLDGIELDGFTIDDVIQMTNQTKTISGPLGNVEVLEGYYSAADICGIIEEACRQALQKMEELNTTTPIKLTREMFETAFLKIKPSISKELLDSYENFSKKMTLN